MIVMSSCVWQKLNSFMVISCHTFILVCKVITQNRYLKILFVRCRLISIQKFRLYISQVYNTEKLWRSITPILFGCEPSMFTAISQNKMMMVERTMGVMWQILHAYRTMSCQSVWKDFQYNHIIEKECLYALVLVLQGSCVVHLRHTSF